MTTKWEQTEKQYQDLKEAGTLDEIEPIPDTVHEKAKEAARGLLRKPYRPLKEWQDEENEAAG